jgi:hypothetical protein
MFAAIHRASSRVSNPVHPRNTRRQVLARCGRNVHGTAAERTSPPLRGCARYRRERTRQVSRPAAPSLVTTSEIWDLVAVLYPKRANKSLAILAHACSNACEVAFLRAQKRRSQLAASTTSKHALAAPAVVPELRSSVDNPWGGLPGLREGCLLIWRQCGCRAPTRTGIHHG